MTAPKKTKKKPETDAALIERMAQAMFADAEAVDAEAMAEPARQWADICDDERDGYRQLAAVALAASRGEKPRVIVAETTPLVGKGQSAFVEDCKLVTRLTGTGHERILVLKDESSHVLQPSPSLDAHMAGWLLSLAPDVGPWDRTSVPAPKKGLVRG